jgi:hypothetical protein
MTTRYELFREISLFLKRFIMFLIQHCVEKLPNFISFPDWFYVKFISDPELPGSGASWIRSCPDPE